MTDKILKEIAEPFGTAHVHLDTAHQRVNSIMMQVEAGHLECSAADRATLTAMLAIVQMSHDVFAKAAAALRALSNDG